MAGAVRGASGMVTTLPPLRVMTRVRCPRFRPRRSISAPVASDTRSPFRGHQGEQHVLGGRSESRGDEDRAELVAVQGGDVRFVVEPGAADVRGGRVLE
jgi:hypothetical protein